MPTPPALRAALAAARQQPLAEHRASPDAAAQPTRSSSRSSVVLPLPLGPTKAIRSPRLDREMVDRQDQRAVHG